MKRVVRVVESRWQGEGRGARVRRSIGRPELRNLDPFLLLDEFQGSAKEGAGFPDHPHRGFETVTYLLEGEFTHEDFAGNKGVLRPGDLQWMTAGRGVVHSEMPGEAMTRGLQEIAVGWTSLVYILAGSVRCGDTEVAAHHTAVLTSEEALLEVECAMAAPAHLVIIAGRPLGEEVAQHGPFVMNTQAEIRQAIEDFRRSQNGFERARHWRSVEGNK